MKSINTYITFDGNCAEAMPNQDMFWGAYFGMLTDKFGINWMFNYDKAKN